MKTKVPVMFKVEYESKEYEAQEFSKYCEENHLIVEGEIKKCNIIYNGVKYTFEEYQKNLIENSKKFKADTADTHYILTPEFVFLYDTNLYVCLKYLSSLCSNITAGHLYAILSYEKLPTHLYGVDSYFGCFFRRCLDFSTSILWYNSAIDYFLQIFCSRFNLYQNITSKNVTIMNFEELSSLCTYNKVSNAIQKMMKTTIDSEVLKWWQKIDNCCAKLTWIRSISNSLKHKSGVSYNKINLKPLMEIQKETKKMSEMYLPIEVDIDADYDKIIEAHNEIVDVYSFIVAEINTEIEVKKKAWEQKMNSKENL